MTTVGKNVRFFGEIDESLDIDTRSVALGRTGSRARSINRPLVDCSDPPQKIRDSHDLHATPAV